MLRLTLSETILAAAVVAFTTGYSHADEFSARLNGFEELGSLNAQTGAVLSNGSGKVSLLLHKNSIDYTLTYSNVGTTQPGAGTVSQAHIHFGKSRDSGGILVFFCTNVALPPTFTGPTPVQTCPKTSGTVSGTWTGVDVQAIRSQNVRAGDFDALIDAIESNTAYANIHTISGTMPDTAFPAGEIRGQIRSEDREDQDDNHDHHY